MSILDWSGRASEIPPYLRDEQRAYSLPMILRLEKGVDLPTHEQVLLASSFAIATLFDDERLVSEPLWADSIKAWMDGRIRKVARRARASAWDAVRSSECVYVNYEGVEICILPPHPLDETPDVIRKLQVAGLDLEREAPSSQDVSGLEVALNPMVEMSTGKSMAQVGHATQIAIFDSSEETLKTWSDKGFPVSLVAWDSHKEWTAEIQDAGFTEVTPGTVTTRSFLLGI